MLHPAAFLCLLGSVEGWRLATSLDRHGRSFSTLSRPGFRIGRLPKRISRPRLRLQVARLGINQVVARGCPPSISLAAPPSVMVWHVPIEGPGTNFTRSTKLESRNQTSSARPHSLRSSKCQQAETTCLSHGLGGPARHRRARMALATQDETAS